MTSIGPASIESLARLRAAGATGAHASSSSSGSAPGLVTLYDNTAGSMLLVRSADDPTPSGTPLLDDVRARATAQAQWLADRFDHPGSDGHGSPFSVAAASGTFYRDGIVQLGVHESSGMVALYRETEAIRHELVHAVIDHAAPGLSADPEGHMVHEAWAMVLQNDGDDDWMANEDAYTPQARAAGARIHDLAKPVHATIADAPYHDSWHAVTLGSAAVRAADSIGRDHVMRIWFDAIAGMAPSTDEEHAAQLTVDAARARYGAGEATVVADAWRAIGIEPTGSRRPADVPRTIPTPVVAAGAAVVAAAVGAALLMLLRRR